MNTRKRSSNTSSIYKGVSWSKERNRWEARIRKDKRKYHIGYFHDGREAARAHNRKAMELFGEHAHLNDIPDDDEGTIFSEDPLNVHYL